MKEILDTFDYFVDDSLLSHDPPSTHELDLLAVVAFPDKTQEYEDLYAA